jgi:hypothetical protein
MTALELTLAVVGVGVTALVAVAMVLIVPAGTVEVHREGEDPEGSPLSPRPTSDGSPAHETRATAPTQ